MLIDPISPKITGLSYLKVLVCNSLDNLYGINKVSLLLKKRKKKTQMMKMKKIKKKLKQKEKKDTKPMKKLVVETLCKLTMEIMINKELMSSELKKNSLLLTNLDT